MARSHANGGHIYRAVVEVRHPSGEVTILTYGPYDKPGTARGQLTRSLNEWQWGTKGNVSGHVESAEVVWMREQSTH